MTTLSNEINKDIDISVTKLKYSLEAASNVQAKLEKIEGLLKDNRWTGDSNVKCQDIHQLLLMYNKEVSSLVEQINKSVCGLDNSCQSFDSKSV